MKGTGTTLFLWIAAMFLALILVALAWSNASAAGSLFTVHEPERGLFHMHPELVKEQP